jgi:signal transduction histidine kinase/DNA-binding response OmpR family regulator
MKAKTRLSGLYSHLACGKTKHNLLAGLVLAGGCLLAYAFYIQLRDQETADVKDDFELAAQDRIHAIKKTLDVDLLIMKAVRAFYTSSDDVEPHEFYTFATSITSDHQSIRALEWAPMKRDGEGTVRFPIAFAAPHQGNIAPLGFDLSEDSDCWEAMQRARDSGDWAATSRIMLFKYPGTGVGLRFFLAVYKQGQPADTVERRRDSLEGFAVVVYRVSRFVDESLAALTPGAVNINIFDRSAPLEDQALHYHESRNTEQTGPSIMDLNDRTNLKMTHVENFDVGGRKWEIVCTPTAEFVAERTTNYPLVGAIVILLAAGLVALQLRHCFSQRVQSEMAADQLACAKRELELEIEKRSKTEEIAESANKAKCQFVAGVNHEMRTPLTAILGFTELMKSSSLSQSNLQDYLNVIRRNAEHLLFLINDLLDLYKIKAGKLTIHYERCSVLSVMAEVASMMRPRAEKRGTSFEIQYDGSIPEIIHADLSRLRQAIVNLSMNAVKNAEHGSVRVVASTIDRWKNGLPALKVDMIDTGPPIDQEAISQIFQHFCEAGDSTANKFSGQMLGLAVTRRLAEMLGGELTVTSGYGKANTFTLIVPTGDLQGVRMLANPADSTTDATDESNSADSQDLFGLRILLAEDGIDNREFIRIVLSQAGAEVQVAENGRVAVRKAEAERFDVILMDINMPEMDGCEATRLLREQGYNRPILALTANVMPGDERQCLEAGCNGYLTKPINRAQLVGSIAEYSKKITNVLFDSATEAQLDTPRKCDTLVSAYADDPDIVPILGEFIDRLGGHVAAMQTALAENHYEVLQRLAHNMKGSGGNYGFQAITNAAKVLEEAAKARNASQAGKLIAKLDEIRKAVERGRGAAQATEGDRCKKS